MLPRRLPCWCLVFITLLLPPIALRAQSHFVRLGDAHAGNVGPVAIATLADERVIAAVADWAGYLELIVWDVTADGKFTHRGSASAGPASEFALTTVSRTSAVTAVRRQNGSLRLIDWAIDSGGNVTRKGQIDAGPVERIDVIAAGPSRVVTATVAAGQTKLIVWDLNDAGEFTRRGDHDASAGTRAAVAALSAGQLVVAVRDTSGKLDVSSWSLNQAGNVAPLQSTKGTNVGEVAIINTALDRAVTACTLPDGTVELQAWDVDAAGKVIAASSAKAGTADNVALAAMGSAKVVTALRQSDHTLKVISWHVVDTLARLDSIAAGPVGAVSVAVLGWDRVIPAVQDANKNLELIDYADFSVALLHAQWGPASTIKVPILPIFGGVSGAKSATKSDAEDLMLRPSIVTASRRRIDVAAERAEVPQTVSPRPGPPQPPQGQSPNPALVFYPAINGIDLTIAVGKEYVILTEGTTFEFLYKNGPKAGQQLDSKAGEKTLMSATEFFGGFFTPTNADGSVNRNNVNLYLHFPPNFDPKYACMPSPSLKPPCMYKGYDSRVTYDPYRGRFIVMSHVAGEALKDDATSAVSRRYDAIAVSRTEDPRDGFIQTMTTESNYSDWPRIATADGLLVVAHNSCKDPDGNNFCKRVQDYLTNAVPLQPMAYVYRIDDLIQHQPAPRNWKIYPYQVEGGAFYPVAHHGSTGGWTYLVKPTGSGLDVYGFKQPLNDWTSIPPLAKSSFALENGASGFREAMHFQNGRLYMGSAIPVADRVPNTAPQRWHVRGVRIPISTSANGAINAGPCPATEGCLDFHFGLHAPEDAPGDVLSYEMPSLAPDANGDMILVYGRVPVQMANPIGQEARFSIYYDDARGLQRSRLIKGGGAVIKEVYCVANTTETIPVATNYWRICQGSFLDYATAAVDPDGKSFWVVHAYSASNGFKMVGAKVVP